MTVRIQLRRGTAAEWTSANPTLALGEMGLETDTGKFKVGDGTTGWSSLAYSSGPAGPTGPTGPIGPTGTVSAAGDGTAAAPGIAFASDTNTGIYRPGADQLAISTNGTGRLFVDASGNIKLTSNQLQALAHKNFGYTGSYGAVVVGAGGSNYGNISLGVDISAIIGGNFNGQNQVVFPATGGLIPNNAGSNFVGFYNRNASDALVLGPATVSGITSGPLTLTSTSVGIGTSSPSSLLEVSSATTSYIRSSSTTNSISGVIGAATSSFDVGTTSSHAMNFYTAGVNRATLDTSGRLGIGTTAPSSFDAEANQLVVGSGAGDQGITIYTGSSAGDHGSIFFADGTTGSAVKKGQIRYEQNNEVMSFWTNETERCRIDLSGRLLVGTSTQQGGNLLQTFGNLGLTKTASGNQINFYGTAIEFVNRNATARSMDFYVGASGGAPLASLSTAGVWTDASDISNKTNIQEIQYGIAAVKSLLPRQYDVISDGTHAVGFVAQEVQNVIPEVVNSTITEDGAEFLGLAYGQLTAVLTKALQEAIAKIETLEAKVAALETP